MVARAPLKGLFEGPPHINARVSLQPGQQAFPLLIWVSQWKLLQKVALWEAKDEMVDMVLRANADVNAQMPNNTNALFFAVKYGTEETVDLLIKAGINIQQRDDLGQTCLHNALEYPSPRVLSRLLEHFGCSRNVSVIVS